MSISESTRIELIDQFAKLTSNPGLWLTSARQLYASAKILGVRINQYWEANDPRRVKGKEYPIQDDLYVTGIQSSYLMLMAFALENLFKAYLVQTHSLGFRKCVTKNGRLPKALLTHDLRTLARRCRINLGPDVATQLTRLTRFSVWSGRYHFLLEFGAFYHLSPQNDIPSNGIAFSSTDVKDMAELVELISQKTGLKITPQGAA